MTKRKRFEEFMNKIVIAGIKVPEDFAIAVVVDSVEDFLDDIPPVKGLTFPLTFTSVIQNETALITYCGHQVLLVKKSVDDEILDFIQR
jgi:hypothetical protein